MSKLTCISGNNKGDEFPLHEGQNTAGRAHDCNIVVFDQQCSRQHVQIWKRGDNFSIKDLNSRNGTYLNGKKLDQSYETVKIGDTINIGNTAMQLSDKPIGTMLDQTATDVAEELQTKQYDKLLNKTYKSLKKNDKKEHRNFFDKVKSLFTSRK